MTSKFILPWSSLQLRSFKVRVGDVIKILNNETIPADIVLLNTSDKDGLAYIETANLDGYIQKPLHLSA